MGGTEARGFERSGDRCVSEGGDERRDIPESPDAMIKLSKSGW
jgi:hypothetical protein